MRHSLLVMNYLNIIHLVRFIFLFYALLLPLVVFVVRAHVCSVFCCAEKCLRISEVFGYDWRSFESGPCSFIFLIRQNLFEVFIEFVIGKVNWEFKRYFIYFIGCRYNKRGP